jgi:hypothetical protein
MEEAAVIGTKLVEKYFGEEWRGDVSYCCSWHRWKIGLRQE